MDLKQSIGNVQNVFANSVIHLGHLKNIAYV